ncbi:MgtC/SapB family protein [Clostridium sp. 'deep sea']|uniref:MgtC/SapB family protein n=1 Tax=Clostridium sp. 'deep sea' TaxID=2779445 RepID=UPI0018964B03|nr:MgtC/SapB family protein [Clostridium sp. 'deep sea']QOR35986.1 MgtC/SapB family protein [Clostridium sp. 'deep sea']
MEELIIKLVVAVLLGGIIGWEREHTARPAGLRTHILVCVGSALMTILSMEAFSGADPSRVAAQIVSGIGFLGAGTIMREGLSVKGLTTAASLWATAGIGMAVGTGYFSAAIITTVLVFLTLTAMLLREKGVISSTYRKKVIIEGRNKPGLLGQVGTILGEYDIDIDSVQLKTEDNDIFIELTVRLPGKADIGAVVETLRKVDVVRSIEIE